jgi:TsgA-like MFS transporter
MKIGFNVWIAYLIFVFQGLASPLVGVLIMEIARKYSVDTSIIGYVFALGVIGGGIAALASGFLIETFGKRKIVFAGILIALLAGATITTASYLPIFALGMILSAVSNWFLVAVANFIIVRTYHGEKRSSQLNLLNFFFSVGALITPFLAGFMLKKNIPWEFVFLTPFVLLGILAVLVYSPAFSSSHSKSSMSQVTQVVSNGNWDINIYITGLALGLYCLLEISFTSWIVVYLRENLAVDIVAASLVLTTFFICQATGRAISGFIVKHVALNTYIIACSALCLAAASLLVFSTSYVVVICLTVPLGLGMASLYPSILSYGTLQVKVASPRIMTFFMTSGIAGSVSGLLLTSFLKQQFGVLACIITIAAALVLLIACIGTTMMRGYISNRHA